MNENVQTARDDDQRLVASCQRGDLDAFEELVRRHQKKMFTIAFRMTGSQEDASEVVQDAFFSAYKSIKTFEQRSKFSTWLSSIVINLSKNRLRQRIATTDCEQYSFDDPHPTEDGSVKYEPVSHGPSALESLERAEIQVQVQRCVNTLETEFREVIVLRDMQEFSYTEISEMLRIPEGTVKSRLSRARDMVKNCLKKVFGRI